MNCSNRHDLPTPAAAKHWRGAGNCLTDHELVTAAVNKARFGKGNRGGRHNKGKKWGCSPIALKKWSCCKFSALKAWETSGPAQGQFRNSGTYSIEALHTTNAAPVSPIIIYLKRYLPRKWDSWVTNNYQTEGQGTAAAAPTVTYAYAILSAANSESSRVLACSQRVQLNSPVPYSTI